MEMDPIVVAGRVRELMNRAGEDVGELHEGLRRAGHYITRATLRNILRARHKTQRRHLEAIAEYYDVEVAFLVGRRVQCAEDPNRQEATRSG